MDSLFVLVGIASEPVIENLLVFGGVRIGNLE